MRHWAWPRPRQCVAGGARARPPVCRQPAAAQPVLPPAALAAVSSAASGKETQKFLAFVTNFRFLRIIALTTMPGFGTSFATCDMIPSHWHRRCACEGQYPLAPAEVRALNSSPPLSQDISGWTPTMSIWPDFWFSSTQPSPAQHHSSQRKCYKKSFSILIC